MAMAKQEGVADLARKLHDAGVINIDKPIRDLVTAPGLHAAAGVINEDGWNAAFGSGYVLVYKT
jgi:hypothetical protein